MKKTLLTAIALFIAMIIINSCTKENLDNQEFKTLDMNTISENFEDFQTTLLSGNPVIIKAGDDEIEVSDLSVDADVTFEGMTFLTSSNDKGEYISVLIHKEDKVILVNETRKNLTKEILSFSNAKDLNAYSKNRTLYTTSSKEVEGYHFNLTKNTLASSIDFSKISKEDKIKIGFSAPKEISGNCEHKDHQHSVSNTLESDFETTSKNNSTVNRTWTIWMYSDGNSLWGVWNWMDWLNLITSWRSLNTGFSATNPGSGPNSFPTYARMNFAFTGLNSNINDPQSAHNTMNAFNNVLESRNAPKNYVIHVFLERDFWRPGSAGGAWEGKHNYNYYRRVAISSTLWSDGAFAHEVGHTLNIGHWNATTQGSNGIMFGGSLQNSVPWYVHQVSAWVARYTLRASN